MTKKPECESVAGAESKSAKDATGPLCPKCGRRGTTRSVRTDELEGSLELSYLLHTEIEEHFACEACGAEWSERAYL
jgi:predicted RNA-binding Zn-ribbon protein involved in translation (DUF1610 family)